MRTTAGLLLVALIALAAGAPARGQEVQRIAAVVNDEVISIYDLIERIKFVTFASGLEPSAELRRRLAPQALRALIDERLRLQEAARNNVTVSEAELAGALAEIEDRNGVSRGQLGDYLRARGLDPRTVIDQLKAQIAWAKLIRRRMGSLLLVSDDEIDEELARIRASAGKPEYRVAEIFLAAEDRENERQTLESARQIVAQIRAGASFSALAREFSAAVTAAAGGALGWVLAEEVDPAVAPVLERLAPGEVSDPIAVDGGYMIVRVEERRRRLAADPDDTQLALAQVLLPLSAGAGEAEREAVRRRASAVAASIQGCASVEAAAQAAGASAGDLGRLRLGDLPADIKRVVASVPVGAASPPIESADGVRLLVVCDRQEAEAPLPDRDQVAELLLAKRFEMASRRYLRDLRREAFVEIRI